MIDYDPLSEFWPNGVVSRQKLESGSKFIWATLGQDPNNQILAKCDPYKFWSTLQFLSQGHTIGSN